MLPSVSVLLVGEQGGVTLVVVPEVVLVVVPEVELVVVPEVVLVGWGSSFLQDKTARLIIRTRPENVRSAFFIVGIFWLMGRKDIKKSSDST